MSRTLFIESKSTTKVSKGRNLLARKQDGTKSILPLQLQEWRWRNDSKWRSGSTPWGAKRQRWSLGLPLSHCSTRPLKTPVILVGHRPGITRMMTDFYKDCFPRDTIPAANTKKSDIKFYFRSPIRQYNWIFLFTGLQKNKANSHNFSVFWGRVLTTDYLGLAYDYEASSTI